MRVHFPPRVASVCVSGAWMRRDRAYGGGMSARVGGRNRAIAWIAGFFCAAVVGVLLWLAQPAGPALIQLIGDGLRNSMP